MSYQSCHPEHTLPEFRSREDRSLPVYDPTEWRIHQQPQIFLPDGSIDNGPPFYEADKVWIPQVTWTFPQFQRLPTELQDKIFEFALPDAAYIKLSNHHDFVDWELNPPRNAFPWFAVETLTDEPHDERNLVDKYTKVCEQQAQIFRKHFKLFDLAVPFPPFEMQIPINVKQDTIILDIHSFIPTKFLQSSELHYIQNLGVEVALSDFSSEITVAYILEVALETAMHFPCFKNLTLIIRTNLEFSVPSNLKSKYQLIEINKDLLELEVAEVQPFRSAPFDINEIQSLINDSETCRSELQRLISSTPRYHRFLKSNIKFATVGYFRGDSLTRFNKVDRLHISPLNPKYRCSGVSYYTARLAARPIEETVGARSRNFIDLESFALSVAATPFGELVTKKKKKRFLHEHQLDIQRCFVRIKEDEARAE